MAVRLDASYDSAVGQIAETARRVSDADPARLSVDDLLEEASAVAEAAREKVSARATLLSVVGVVLLTCMVAALGTGRPGAHAPVSALTVWPSQWRAEQTSVLALLGAVAGLGAVAVQRSLTSRRRLTRALDRHGIAAAAEARDAVIGIGTGAPDKFLADRARRALERLDRAYPGWAGTAELRGDMWAAVAADQRAQEICCVDPEEALRRAREDYAAALTLQPVGASTVGILIRDGDAALTQAMARAPGSRERWRLLLDAAKGAERALAAQPSSAPAAMLLDEAITKLLAEPRTWGAFGAPPARVAEVLRSRLARALDEARRRDTVDYEVLRAWAISQINVLVAAGHGRRKLTSELSGVVDELRDHLTDAAGAVRAAPTNQAALDAIHLASPVLRAAQRALEAVPSQLQRERIAGKWAPLLQVQLSERELRALAERGDLTQPEVVLARALLAYRVVLVDRDLAGALWALLWMPVRCPSGRLSRIRRAVAGSAEAAYIAAVTWLGVAL